MHEHLDLENSLERLLWDGSLTDVCTRVWTKGAGIYGPRRFAVVVPGDVPVEAGLVLHTIDSVSTSGLIPILVCLGKTGHSFLVNTALRSTSFISERVGKST